MAASAAFAFITIKLDCLINLKLDVSKVPDWSMIRLRFQISRLIVNEISRVTIIESRRNKKRWKKTDMN